MKNKMKKYDFIEPYSCIVDDSGRVLSKFFEEEPKTKEELLSIKAVDEMYVVGSIKYNECFVIDSKTFTPNIEIGNSLIVVNRSKNMIETIAPWLKGIRSIDNHFEF